MPKSWSRGLTAATDPRVARNAERHRGMVYQRRLDLADDRRHKGHATRTLPLEWSAEMAYVVGLIATDGCLVGDRRHIAFTTNDRQLAETFLACLGRPVRYGTGRTSAGNVVYRIQMGDVAMYRWLESIGLTPRKSLTLNAVSVPDEFFWPFVRGLLDGDGSIYTLVHAPTARTYPEYRYERLWVYFSSASEAHITWLRLQLRRLLAVEGWIERTHRSHRNPFFRLKYGKRESIMLLSTLYSDPDAPRLERKWKKWDAYRQRHMIGALDGHEPEIRTRSLARLPHDPKRPARSKMDIAPT